MRESRTRLSAGTLPSTRLERLATSHPFVQRIDIVISSRIAQDPFTSLKTTYSTAQFTLSELYEHVSHLAMPFKALPAQCDADDTWCIDPRGIFTLSVSKTLYEKLGVVGKRLQFKGCPERYAIHIPLKRDTTSVAMQARHRNALAVWDEVRAVEGLGKWRVAFVGGSSTSTTKDVTARALRETDVYVPHVGDLAQSTGEEPEPVEDRLEALFEWVGMACLGAQRLHANDRVDPYVAVYEVPEPASIDGVTHLCWKGLMDCTFVRSVINTAISVLSTSESNGDSHPFIAVALHSNLMTPVSYVPESPAKDAPPRVPSLEAEDTVCLLLSKTSSRSTWAIGESIGKWDARWG